MTKPSAFGTTVSLPYERAVARTRKALAAEGFGVLTGIDVAATFEKKRDVDFRPYVILGACNPPLAHRALPAERDIGRLLPCNVNVYADDAPGRSVVAAMDPVEALQLTGHEAVRPLAGAVRARLERVLNPEDRLAHVTSVDARVYRPTPTGWVRPVGRCLGAWRTATCRRAGSAALDAGCRTASQSAIPRGRTRERAPRHRGRATSAP